jgi:hypothetical protein
VTSPEPGDAPRIPAASSERGDAPRAREDFDDVMTATDRRVLLVANRTASTPALLEDVRNRGREGASFLLLIPPETGEAPDWSQDDACRLLGSAAGCMIDTVEPGEDAASTIHGIAQRGECSEVVLSTQPEHHHRWFHHDLPQKLEDLKVPVTVIPPEPNWGPVKGFPASWSHPINPAGIAGLGNY